MAGAVYGLIGRKLGHSWSVPIHQSLGQPDYRLIELEPEELPAFLARRDLGGLNVTIPYKRDVIPYCDVLSDEARAIGSVNTLVRRTDGKLYGWNTDAAGFVFMARRAGISFSGKKAVILGSGGASLAAQAMARAMGARQVTVISRSGEDNYANLSRNADAEIVVNTTPVGMYPRNGAAAVDLRAFPACEGVLDVIYNPRRTALLLQAEELGLPCSDGLPMLVAQAKAAEEHFTGRSIPDSETERILRQLRRDSANLVLIGMPGCGKSTVGAALARLTGRELIDLDARVEAAAGQSIPAIFAGSGEAAFRTLEREAAAECGKLSGKILVTGGGIVKDPRNLPALRQNGRICQLLRDTALLARAGRPLSAGADLSALWAERAPLYARFRDAAIENSGTAEETAAAVWRDFCEHSGD
jgi:Shikimate 5-dehydrogenase